MSAPIVEPQFVDTADIAPTLAVAEQVEHGRQRQSAIQSVADRPVSHAAGALSDASPWIISTTRRCIDGAVAGIALVLLLPAMLLVMFLVRVSSPGTPLFSQRRAGRNRKEFTLYKFRSMRVGNSPGPAITVSGDARITPIGAFLRRFKLDELPQFWNVLNGDMSLVGPRPKLPHHEGLDLPCRPGITGLATLQFRNEEEILSGIPDYEIEDFYRSCVKPRKAQLDLEYMRSATLWTDLKLLWRTVSSCVFGPDNLSLKETAELTRLVAAWQNPSCGRFSDISLSQANTGGRVQSEIDKTKEFILE
jgi:lipopolysaccharide/colanic/teichoic acid biosynthesis glycosyltransferase